MPKAGVTRSEGPLDGFKCDTGLDVWVFIDIDGVIKINKIIGTDLVKDYYNGKHQSHTNPIERSFKKKDLKELW